MYRPVLESPMGFEATKRSSENCAVARLQKWCHLYLCGESEAKPIHSQVYLLSLHEKRYKKKKETIRTPTPSVQEILRAEAQRGSVIGTGNTLLLTLKALVLPLIASLTWAKLCGYVKRMKVAKNNKTAVIAPCHTQLFLKIHLVRITDQPCETWNSSEPLTSWLQQGRASQPGAILWLQNSTGFKAANTSSHIGTSAMSVILWAIFQSNIFRSDF